MPTILVVDDEAIDREATAKCLRTIDELEILEAHDGNEALEQIFEHNPDLVLTDLRMPGMDGVKLVERLREEMPSLPVVLITAQGSEQIAVRALKAGASSYVPKRDIKEDLADVVEQLLEVIDARRSRAHVLRYMGQRETEFKLENDPSLITPVAAFFEDSLERLGFGDETIRAQVGMSLMEAVSNAMIHGNLEVGSDLRRDSTRRYYEIIEQRRGKAPYADRHVHCVARESSDQVEYVIRDEGAGFDHSALPDPTAPDNMARVRGRGLFLIRTFMDGVEFNESGNRITMIKES